MKFLKFPFNLLWRILELILEFLKTTFNSNKHKTN